MSGDPLPNDAAPEPSPSPPPQKADPETLVLRTRPDRVVRFKRSVIVALSALAVSGIVAAAWLALKPRSLQIVAEPGEAGEPARAPADAIETLPSTYAETPKLGPPLPGDLGRAVLAHQRSLEATGADGTPSEAERTAQAERERIAAEARSARESSVLVQIGGRSPSSPGIADIAAEQTPPAIVAPPARTALEPDAQAKSEAFGASIDSGGDVNPHRIRPAASPYLLSAGSVIAASLITGLRSDLPGLVVAQVTERVYDSPTGRLLLIPQGARLIGSYDSMVAFGQKRALIVWQRIVFPDGRSLRIDNVPASDPAGYAGLADKVDFHTWSLLQGAALSTLLGVGANLTFSGESDLVRAIRESTQQNVSRAGDQLVSRSLQIQPTISIRPGTPVRLVVHRDLVLAPSAG